MVNICFLVILNNLYTLRVPMWYMGTHSGMRLGFGKNSGKFYVAIDSSPIQHSQL